MKGKIKFFRPVGWGYIICEDLAKDVFISKADILNADPQSLVPGDWVEFDVFEQLNGKGPKARNVRRLDAPGGASPTPAHGGHTHPLEKSTSPKFRRRIFEWSFIYNIPEMLQALKGVALDEGWEFSGWNDAEHPFPILWNYLCYTFVRLEREQKVLEKQSDGIAAFNTGLVDRRYEPIYALFQKNTRPGAQPWRYSCFCIAGEGPFGKTLVRQFNPLPEPAHYFDNISDLLYDTFGPLPSVDWEHVILENLTRLPEQFVGENCPTSFSCEDTSKMPVSEKQAYFDRFAEAIKSDLKAYRAIKNRMQDALGLAIKRTRWNFKTAIPMYYPTLNTMSLLLPLALVSDEEVDVALVVEKTHSGNYLGHTILPLDWAYSNARLVCRPDSDWLIPQNIVQVSDVGILPTSPDDSSE